MAACFSILVWRIPWARSLAGYRPGGLKELNTTEKTQTHVFLYHPTSQMCQKNKVLRNKLQPNTDSKKWENEAKMNQLQMRQKANKKKEGRFKSKHINNHSKSVQFSRSVMSNSLWPHGLQHARLPCLSPIPRVYSNSCPLSQWCHPTISSSVIPFPSCLQSFPASGSFHSKEPQLKVKIFITVNKARSSIQKLLRKTYFKYEDTNRSLKDYTIPNI